MQEPASLTIVVVNDDPDDRLLFELELQNIQSAVTVLFVAGEEEFFECLDACRWNSDSGTALRPQLILLDPFTPRLNLGRTIARIQADEWLRKVSIVVLIDSIDEGEYLKEKYPLETLNTLFRPGKGTQLASQLCGFRLVE